MARTFSDGTEGQPGAGPESTLASGIAIGATSLAVQAGHGERFPASGTFSVRIEDVSNPAHFEIVDCSSRSTDTLTIGATTFAWDSGDKVFHVIAKGDLEGFVQGPVSVTDDNPAVFDGTTGKLIKQKTYAAFKTLLSLVKGDVGLGNVDNTSDANKPVSTATQTALDSKQALSAYDAKGDLLVGTAADTSGKLTVGANGSFPVADSGAATGIAWRLPSEAEVATDETTTSNTFTDLATPGPAVTVTTGTQAIVIISAASYSGTQEKYMGVDVSGASTVAATVNEALCNATANVFQAAQVIFLSGLTPGSNTFTAKYRTSGGATANFTRRRLTVIPL